VAAPMPGNVANVFARVAGTITSLMNPNDPAW